MGAAFGLAQLESLDNNIRVRKQNFLKQCNFFNNYEMFFENPIEQNLASTAWLAFPILIKKEAPFKRRDLQIYLEERNIQTRVVFTGNVIRQPMMKNVEYRTNSNGYPNADAVMERGVLLPLHHGMTEDMFARLHKITSEFIKKYI